MKNISFIVAFMFLSASQARDGGTVGNGGDTYAIQFIETAREVATLLEDRQSKIVSARRLRKAINSTFVDSTDEKLFLDSIRKDAINYPDLKKIILNRNAWSSLPNDRTRMLFVIHEYLGILRVDDSRYAESAALLNEITRGSLVCVSVFHNAQGDFAVTGKSVVKLDGRDEAKWSDELYTYRLSVNSFLKPSFFVLGVFNSDSDPVQRVSTHLNMLAPAVNVNFATTTEKLLNDFRITDVEVECH